MVNAESSTATFGSSNPELSILTGELNYPYLIGDLAMISRSQFGREFYQYFYDWKMEPLVETCRTAVTPYRLSFLLSSISEPLDFELAIFPNPTSDQLNIVSEKQINTVTIIDYTGRTLRNMQVNSSNVNLILGDLENGNYLLKLQGDDFQTVSQLVKIK